MPLRWFLIWTLLLITTTYVNAFTASIEGPQTVTAPATAVVQWAHVAGDLSGIVMNVVELPNLNTVQASSAPDDQQSGQFTMNLDQAGQFSVHAVAKNANNEDITIFTTPPITVNPGSGNNGGGDPATTSTKAQATTTKAPSNPTTAQNQQTTNNGATTNPSIQQTTNGGGSNGNTGGDGNGGTTNNGAGADASATAGGSAGAVTETATVTTGATGNGNGSNGTSGQTIETIGTVGATGVLASGTLPLGSSSSSSDGDPNNPTSGSTTPGTDTSLSNHKSINVGMIVGIIVAILLLLSAIALFLFLRRRRRVQEGLNAVPFEPSTPAMSQTMEAERSKGRFAHFPGLTPRGSALPLSGAAFADGERGYEEDLSESARAPSPSSPYVSLSTADNSPASSDSPILSPPRPETKSQLPYTQSLASQAGAGALPLPPPPPSSFSSRRNRNLARASVSTTSQDRDPATSGNEYPSDSEKSRLASAFDASSNLSGGTNQTSGQERNSAALSQSDVGSGSDPSTTGYGGIEPLTEGEPVAWRWTLMRVPVYGDEASSSARSVELPSYTAAIAR